MESHKPSKNFPEPPASSPAARRIARRVAAPVERFLHNETSSGFLLLGMAVIALAWANSPWSHSYHALWHMPVTLGIGDFSVTQSLHFWINDFLMTFFFMVAGAEIKRELVEGELSDLRRASLPAAAAIGGMLFPALIYFGFNPSGPTASGWGVPMATDIAFALGALVLMGDRVPAALRILLLALAIIDDLGAILVIAIFYSTGFKLLGLAIVGIGCLVLLLFIRLGVRFGVTYFIPLMILWIGLLQTGVHPTIAGVIVGMSISVRPRLAREQFLAISSESIAEFETATKEGSNSGAMIASLSRLSLASREAIAPVVRLQTAFHGWVSFFIMPLFALANAGVNLSGIDFGDPAALPVMLGISLGLMIGKPIGVVLVSWVLVRLGWATLPRGVTWSGMLVLGFCAGIGFTMAIFVAELGLPPETLGVGKLAILIATLGAAVLGMVLGRIFLSKQLAPDVAAVSPAEAEASTEY